jgi:hypothetical protein
MSTAHYPEFAERAGARPQSFATDDQLARGLDACDAATAFFRDYARERPEVVALWAFGIGFVLAWKLKPW